MKKSCHPNYESEIKRINRISGQVNGIKKMVEEGQYCPDVVNQILSAAASLHSLGGIMLKEHIQHCVYEVFESNDKREKDQKMEEIINLYNKKIG